MNQPHYKRVLLKLSGEALMGDQGLGIDPKIEPVEITADDFDEQVERQRSPRAKASEM